MRFEKENGSFAAALKELGIGRGDLLTVSSDITTLLFRMSTEYGIRGRNERNAALDELINTLQEAVGTEGTLLFPVFSWDWCRGKGFDIRTTKGEVGALQNWVLENRADFRRTRHPMYSFMVWGKDAETLAAMDNQDAWGPASPFRYLQDHGGKHLLFNVDSWQALTFCHYVEQEVRVPYRHPKYFFGQYTDGRGVTETRMYSMYVRDMDMEAAVGVHNDWLAENGAAKKVLWEENTLTAVDLPKSYPLIRDDMLHNRGRNTLKLSTGELDMDAPRTAAYEVKGIKE